MHLASAAGSDGSSLADGFVRARYIRMAGASVRRLSAPPMRLGTPSKAGTRPFGLIALHAGVEVVSPSRDPEAEISVSS